MDFPIAIGKDLVAEAKIVGGKVIVSIEYDGADAALEALKAHLPGWLAPVIDLAKKEVDSL